MTEGALQKERRSRSLSGGMTGMIRGGVVKILLRREGRCFVTLWFLAVHIGFSIHGVITRNRSRTLFRG